MSRRTYCSWVVDTFQDGRAARISLVGMSIIVESDGHASAGAAYAGPTVYMYTMCA
jgi:hypothetical protein